MVNIYADYVFRASPLEQVQRQKNFFNSPSLIFHEITNRTEKAVCPKKEGARCAGAADGVE